MNENSKQPKAKSGKICTKTFEHQFVKQLLLNVFCTWQRKIIWKEKTIREENSGKEGRTMKEEIHWRNRKWEWRKKVKNYMFKEENEKTPWEESEGREQTNKNKESKSWE